MHERRSVLLIDVLSRIWSKIRARHPGVPGVVLLAAPAKRALPNSLGHFAALRWKASREGQHPIHEVVVVAEYLDRPAEEIVGTLLHEATHSFNYERRRRDCSANQYHNKLFQETAQALGLDVAQIPHYGWARTRLTSATKNVYEEEIEALQEVQIHRRPLSVPTGPKPPTGGTSSDDEGASRSRSRKATCACPFIIRVSKKTIEDTIIRCESCGEPFQLASA